METGGIDGYARQALIKQTKGVTPRPDFISVKVGRAFISNNS